MVFPYLRAKISSFPKVLERAKGSVAAPHHNLRLMISPTPEPTKTILHLSIEILKLI